MSGAGGGLGKNFPEEEFYFYGQNVWEILQGEMFRGLFGENFPGNFSQRENVREVLITGLYV